MSLNWSNLREKYSLLYVSDDQGNVLGEFTKRDLEQILEQMEDEA